MITSAVDHLNSLKANPHLSWGNRCSQELGYPNINKSNPASLNFEHELPCWVQEELPRREMLGLEERKEEIKTRSYRAQQERGEEEEEACMVCRDQSLHISQDDCATVLASLKAYTKSKDLHRGSELHTKITRSGLLKNNLYVGNSLINLYSKCGALEKAQEVFDELPVRDTISWNILITGYAHEERGEEALRCFESMQLGGFSPSVFTFVSVLKVCSSIGGADKSQQLHCQIVKNDLLQNNIHVGTALVDAYVKHGLLDKAQEVFEELQVRDVVSWTALIMGYAHHGYGNEALGCFLHMQCEGISPNLVTMVCLFKACGSIGAVNKGQELHAQIFRECLLEKNIVVANSLLDMYIKCGSLEKAQDVFDELLVQDAFTWTTLITGLVQHGHDEEAINHFEQMQRLGFSPDVVTFASILKACGSIGAADMGQEIHAQTIKDGLLAKDIHVGTAVIDMYVKCGLLRKAQEVFHEFEVRDLVMWNALISAYAQREKFEEVLHCFEQMQLQGFTADVFTYTSILMVCCSKKALFKGQELHTEIVKGGVLEKDPAVVTGLVDMYAHCDMLTEAHKVFEKLPTRDVCLWNALIRGYSCHGHNKEVLHFLEEMQLGGLSPDAVTCVCALKACGSTGAVDKGQELHAHIIRDEILERDVNVSTTVVDMYAKCGLLEEALQVFEELQVRDVVSWNVLIVGHTQHGHGEEALKCFEHMKLEGFSPDTATFSCILKACSSIGAAYKGHQIHAQIVRVGGLEKDMAVGTAIVDMYANYGMLVEARDVFDKLPVRDIASWNALMVGYAQLGQEETVNTLFSEILEEGKMPNAITFIIALNACSHRGLLAEAEAYFQILCDVYSISPTIEHHTCMVNLFCRAGQLHKAVAVIEDMPLFGTQTLWHTLLNACQNWGDTKLGGWVFEHAANADNKDAAAFVCMSNIHAAACSQEDEEV